MYKRQVRILLYGAALEAEVVVRLKIEKDAEIHKDGRAQQRQHSNDFFQGVRPLSEIGIQEADGARQIPVVEQKAQEDKPVSYTHLIELLKRELLKRDAEVLRLKKSIELERGDAKRK